MVSLPHVAFMLGFTNQIEGAALQSAQSDQGFAGASRMHMHIMLLSSTGPLTFGGWGLMLHGGLTAGFFHPLDVQTGSQSRFQEAVWQLQEKYAPPFCHASPADAGANTRGCVPSAALLMGGNAGQPRASTAKSAQGQGQAEIISPLRNKGRAGKQRLQSHSFVLCATQSVKMRSGQVLLQSARLQKVECDFLACAALDVFSEI